MKIFELVLRLPNSYSLSQKIHSRIKRCVNLWAGPVMLMFALFLTACGGGGNTAGIVEFNIGNDVEFSDLGAAQPDFLAGPPINVSQAATLVRLALIAKGSGQNVKMALYSDDGAGGAPGTLVAETAPTLIAAVGPLEIPVLTEVALSPGDYFIMAVYDTGAPLGVDLTVTPLVYFQPITFTDQVPDPFGTAASFTGFLHNYYMVVNNS